MKKLLADYFKRTPSFQRVLKTYLPDKFVTIDHIAYRTLQSGNLIHLHKTRGFTVQPEKYDFPLLNTSALYMKRDFTDLRIFISETKRPPSEIPSISSLSDYHDLMAKDQYLAWVLIHGNAINHLAVQVRQIDRLFQLISENQAFQIGVPVRTSRDKKLKQFSLQADPMLYEFKNGERGIVAGSFVEFIERADGREGFDTDNARQIFQSTSFTAEMTNENNLDA